MQNSEDLLVESRSPSDSESDTGMKIVLLPEAHHFLAVVRHIYKQPNAYLILLTIELMTLSKTCYPKTGQKIDDIILCILSERTDCTQYSEICTHIKGQTDTRLTYLLYHHYRHQ